jgi:hypothetical protein
VEVYYQQIGGFVNRATSAVKPFVGIAANVADKFKPGLASAIQTGFDVVDGISGQLKGGAPSLSPSGRSIYADSPGKQAIDSRRLAQFNSQFKPTFKPNGKVDSILNNRIQSPRKPEAIDARRLAGGGSRAYDSDEDDVSEVSDEVEE